MMFLRRKILHPSSSNPGSLAPQLRRPWQAAVEADLEGNWAVVAEAKPRGARVVAAFVRRFGGCEFVDVIHRDKGGEEMFQ